MYSGFPWKIWRNYRKGDIQVEMANIKMAKRGTWSELLVSNATRKCTFKTTVSRLIRRVKYPEAKKNQKPMDLNLLLPGVTRDLKVDNPRLNYLMILLTLFAINVGGGTQVAYGTTRMITRPRSKWASSNILPSMLHPIMMTTPLVEEDCIWWEVFLGSEQKTPVTEVTSDTIYDRN